MFNSLTFNFITQLTTTLLDKILQAGKLCRMLTFIKFQKKKKKNLDVY